MCSTREDTEKPGEREQPLLCEKDVARDRG